MALVKERHNEVKQGLDKLLNALARADQNLVKSANAELSASLLQLKASIAIGHWPNWLKNLSENCENYKRNHNNGLATWRAHLNSIINNSHGLETEGWYFGEKPDILFDADAIIAKARADHQIDDLYMKIITCLRAIIDSEHIDSVRATADLNKIIASLDTARSGSFSSQVFNWRFARRLIPNIISSYVKRNSVTGPLLEAFEQTASELDISLDRAKDQIGTEILAAADAALRTDCAKEITQESLLFIGHSPTDSTVSD